MNRLTKEQRLAAKIAKQKLSAVKKRIADDMDLMAVSGDFLHLETFEGVEIFEGSDTSPYVFFVGCKVFADIKGCRRFISKNQKTLVANSIILGNHAGSTIGFGEHPLKKKQ